MSKQTNSILTALSRSTMMVAATALIATPALAGSMATSADRDSMRKMHDRMSVDAPARAAERPALQLMQSADGEDRFYSLTRGAVSASNLLDAPVVSGTQDEVGEVDDLLLTQTGDVQHVIVDLEPIHSMPDKNVMADFDRAIFYRSLEDELSLRTGESQIELTVAPQWYGPAQTLFSADDLIGSHVALSSEGDTAEIKDMIIGRDGFARHAILSHGGIADIGDKLVAVPLSELDAPTRADVQFSIDMSEQSIETMTEFRYPES